MVLAVTNIPLTSLENDTNDAKELSTLNDVWEEEPARDGDDGTGPPAGDDDEDDVEEPPPGGEDGNPDPPKNLVIE